MLLSNVLTGLRAPLGEINNNNINVVIENIIQSSNIMQRMSRIIVNIIIFIIVFIVIDLVMFIIVINLVMFINDLHPSSSCEKKLVRA